MVIYTMSSLMYYRDESIANQKCVTMNFKKILEKAKRPTEYYRELTVWDDEYLVYVSIYFPNKGWTRKFKGAMCDEAHESVLFLENILDI